MDGVDLRQGQAVCLKSRPIPGRLAQVRGDTFATPDSPLPTAAMSGGR